MGPLLPLPPPLPPPLLLLTCPVQSSWPRPPLPLLQHWPLPWLLLPLLMVVVGCS
jgi:hypothetical protein